MPQPLLALEDVRTEFATPRGVVRAVDGVDLAIGAGETLAVVGESGSGKSVTALSILRLFARGDRASVAGRIAWRGRDDRVVDLAALDEKGLREVRGRDIAVIFQDPSASLNPVFSIGAQIREAVRRHHPGEDAARRAVELLRDVGIADPERRVDSFPHQLSGGMRQRAMIAIALACAPRLLIADEPTTALDVTVQAQILELISDLRRQLNMSMVIITHDLGVVANHTDRVAVMYAGELVELADTKELFSRPRMPYTEALMNSIPRLDREPGSRLPSIAGFTPDPTTERTSCGFASRCKYATDKCRNEHPELTDDGNGHLYRCFFPLGGN